METAVTIGMDIAKSVFVVHGVDAAGEVVARRRLTRRRVLPFFGKLPACLVGIEAGAAAHYWGPTAQGTRLRSAANAAELREAVCEATEERCS